MKRKRILNGVIKYVVLIIILVFLLFPLLWVLLTSFKTNMEAYKFPPTFIVKNPTFQSYINLFTVDNDFFTYYKNNFIVAGSTALLTTFMAIISGYALSRFHFKWNKWIIAAFTSAQMFPVVSRLISLYKILGDVHLINTHAGLILAIAAGQLPFTIMLMSSFYDGIPRELEEAARVDGAGRFGTLFRVVVPLVKPGMLAVGIYAFLLSWDDYLHASTLIQTDSLRTLSAGVALRYLGELSYDWSLINTISIVGTIPMVIVFFFFQKYMIKGLVAGAGKKENIMLVTNKENLIEASKNGYAIPALNTQGGNYDIIWAACRAAEEMKSPIILAHYVSTGAYSGHDWFVQVCKWCADKVSVPVSIHLDHGADFDICMEALKLGFTSVMIDGSTSPIEENAAMTNEVIKVAKCFGVPVEAEIGELLRLDNMGTVMENKNIVDPCEVKEFLGLCQPDSLAIGIGNAHGYYKGEPDIHLEVLEAVRKFTDIPLVLHGCTGMKEEIVKEAIKLGVAKINFGTEIRYKYVEHYEEGLKTLDHQGHSWKLSQFANDRLTEDIKDIIRLAGSEGKA